ncbi:MAG: hypothetical protein AAFW97_14185 [Pseudomonadota bacterium]
MSKAPEVQIALFGFLAAFLWEMWQMPFYDQSGLAFMDMVKGCSLGSLGDAGIMVLAYRAAAWIVGSRDWIIDLPRKAVFAYLATGLMITVAIEHIAINIEFGWRYSTLMPLEPVFGTGMVPIIMWVIVPMATLWLVRRPIPSSKP